MIHLKTALAAIVLIAAQEQKTRLEEHVRRLSAPEMGGRMMGTEGERKAAEYIEAELRKAGAEVRVQDFKGHGTTGRNVIGRIKGASDECVVLGAHYDHLGTMKGEVCHGADDNASGTAVVLEIAARLQRSPPRRTVLCVAFSGEEMGLLGSRFYTGQPEIPLEKTVAMVNLDMVGRLREKLIVFGAPSGDRFPDLLADSPIPLAFPKDPFGPSDHTSFLMKGVPSLHLFTGSHPDYHKPGDTADKIDYAGLGRVADFTEKLVRRIADAPDRIKYQKVEMPAATGPARPGAQPYFGSMPDYGHEGKGVRLAGVAAGSPAEKAGLKEGDVIVALNDIDIADVNIYSQVLFARKPGEELRIAYERGGKRMAAKAVLAERRKSDE